MHIKEHIQEGHLQVQGLVPGSGAWTWGVSMPCSMHWDAVCNAVAWHFSRWQQGILCYGELQCFQWIVSPNDNPRIWWNAIYGEPQRRVCLEHNYGDAQWVHVTCHGDNNTNVLSLSPAPSFFNLVCTGPHTCTSSQYCHLSHPRSTQTLLKLIQHSALSLHLNYDKPTTLLYQLPLPACMPTNTLTWNQGCQHITHFKCGFCFNSLTTCCSSTNVGFLPCSTLTQSLLIGWPVLCKCWYAVGVQEEVGWGCWGYQGAVEAKVAALWYHVL